MPSLHAPVAQPDRVVASEAIGRGFESLRARQIITPAVDNSAYNGATVMLRAVQSEYCS